MSPTRFDSVEWRAWDNQRQYFGTNDDVYFRFDGTNFEIASDTADLVWEIGSDADGMDVLFYGTTTARDMRWDNSRDMLHFRDNAALGIGGAASAAGDMQLAWDATRLIVTPAAENTTWRFGTADAIMDVQFMSNTTGRNLLWDASQRSLYFPGDTTSVSFIRFDILPVDEAPGHPTGSAGNLYVTQNTTDVFLMIFQTTTVRSGVALNSAL